MNTTFDEYSKALGKEVPIGSVDKELRLLWEEDKASTNASLINLAVYSEGKGAILKNTGIIRSVTREHACRAILIGIDTQASETSIRAWITAHCHLSEQGRKSVCCEQIAFQLTGRVTGRFRNTVFAHLNSDLPLVFWWQGELSSIFSERLYSLIDRFVFNSSEWADPLSSFQQIIEVIGVADGPALMDLEWTRSYSLRLAIASLFDDAMAAKNLEYTNNIRIVVHPDHRMAGLQIIAWVVQSTGWQRSSDLGQSSEDEGTEQGDRFYFHTHEGTDVTASIELDASSAPIGLIELSNAEYSVKVLREAGSAYLHQKLDCGERYVDHLIPAPSDESSDLMMDQLSRGSKNTLYRVMMPVFLDLLTPRKT